MKNFKEFYFANWRMSSLGFQLQSGNQLGNVWVHALTLLGVQIWFLGCTSSPHLSMPLPWSQTQGYNRDNLIRTLMLEMIMLYMQLFILGLNYFSFLKFSTSLRARLIFGESWDHCAYRTHPQEENKFFKGRVLLSKLNILFNFGVRNWSCSFKFLKLLNIQVFNHQVPR
jgi:hypothetical protein